MNKKIVLTSLLYVASSITVFAGSVISEIPDEPDTSEKHVFYLHGSAEEADGDNEKYQATVEAIADGADNVISEIRGQTDPNTYAKKIKKQVTFLISKGIPATNITITGFSKGSVITLAAASVINNTKINYVLLAGCSHELNEKYNVTTANTTGRILSIYDADDDKFGTCDGIIKSSEKVKFEEVELESGKGHKLFRIPKEKFISQWRDPLIEWINE